MNRSECIAIISAVAISNAVAGSAAARELATGSATESAASAAVSEQPPAPSSLAAPAGDAGGLEEIVVTARSGSESLTSVPVAVTALSAKDLARYDSSDLLKISQDIPQVQIYSGGAGAGGTFIVRGIGTSGDDAGLSQSVALNLDGSQIARPRTVFLGQFDVQQVEVLKGPQALFFGKNSPAGVVSIKTANPGDHLDGYLKAGYEFKSDEEYAEGAIGGPVTDTLSIRFAARYDKLRGYTYNIGESRPDPDDPAVTLPAPRERWGPHSDSALGRLTVLWRPTANYTSTLKISGGLYEDDDQMGSAEPICAPGYGPNTTLGAVAPNSDCSLNGVKASTDIPPLYNAGVLYGDRWASGRPYSHLTSELVTWQQVFDLAHFQIQANTGFSNLSYQARGNYNQTEFAVFFGGVNENYQGYSQEVRLISNFDGPLNFTVGGYYDHTRDRIPSIIFAYNLGPDAATGSYQAVSEYAEATAHTASGFVQGRYNIASNLELAVGARYTDERHDTVQSTAFLNSNYVGFFSPVGRILDSSLSNSNVSPEATLTWHPSPGQTLYGAYKTGYKSGGISTPTTLTPANTADNLEFGPEKTRGGEIGYKARMDNDRLQFSLTGYYYKIQGLQLASYDAVTVSYFIQNAASAKQRGIEGDASYQVTDRFSVRGAFGYNRLNYGEFDNSACYAYETAAQGCVNGVQDLSGRRLHRAPTFSGSVGIGYDLPVTDNYRVGVNSDVLYTTSYNASELQNPAAFQSSYELVNAAVRLYRTDNKYEVAFIGRNLTSERLIGFVQDRTGGGPGQVTAYGTRPRELALQGTVRF